MAVAPKPNKVTVEEYLALSAASETKLEFVNGEIVEMAMAGGTPDHSLVAANVIGQFFSILPKTCRPYTSDVRVHVPDTDLFTYPDIAVVCGKREVSESDTLSVVNPSMLVEVLSPSTASWDRGGKLAHYQRIPSVRDLVLVDVEARRVERYTRQPDGQWLYAAAAGPGARLTLLGHDVTLDLDAVFDGVGET
jgi:Uma2 family endonuclease